MNIFVAATIWNYYNTLICWSFVYEIIITISFVPVSLSKIYQLNKLSSLLTSNFYLFACFVLGCVFFITWYIYWKCLVATRCSRRRTAKFIWFYPTFKSFPSSFLGGEHKTGFALNLSLPFRRQMDSVQPLYRNSICLN